MWKVEQLLEMAKREDKGDYEILAYYISLLKNSDYTDYDKALKELKEILEVENGKRNII